LPLAHEGEFVGVLWLGFLQPRTLTTDDLQLLTIIAAQLGISVANARLYQQAERERVQLSAVLEATPDAVLLVDRAGRVTVANPAAEVVLSMPAEAAIGRTAAECIPSADLLALLTQPQSELRTLEVPVPPSRVLFASASDITQSDGTITGRVCALWDVTQFKRLDMLKSEFVATVSHDLRAPLTLMRGYSTMLSMVGSVNDQQKDFLRKIQDSIEQMTQLVDNLLDLGRLEAGVGLSLEIVQPQVVVREVADSFRPQALNKRIEIELAAPESLSPIQADGALLRQALANLLDNAIKYTKPGGRVIVRARQHAGRQSFSVEDNGLGIAPTDQARLFEKFYRARHREALKERGTGLGLAIVKSIAEQHGGRITVESQLGSGSVFTLEVPMVLVDPRKTPA
jgi:two-component system, OmpR family, phosphate regulon sensor histidine kinase PhoR